MLTEAEAGVGESARADERIDAAGLTRPGGREHARALADARDHRGAPRADAAPATACARCRSVRGPRDAAALSTAGGRTVLVQARLRGDPDDAARTRRAGRRTRSPRSAREHPGVTLQQAGVGSFDDAIDELVAEDLREPS